MKAGFCGGDRPEAYRAGGIIGRRAYSRGFFAAAHLEETAVVS
jgi:hypothetical protein